MLRRSWWRVVDATIDKPGLVPISSVAATCANRIWGEEPWLQWMMPASDNIGDLSEGAIRLAYAARVNETAAMSQMNELNLMLESASTRAMGIDLEPRRSSRARVAFGMKGKKSKAGKKTVKTKYLVSPDIEK